MLIVVWSLFISVMLLATLKRGAYQTGVYHVLQAVQIEAKPKTCIKFCYSLPAERIRNNVLPDRRRNLWASKQDEFVDWMTKAITFADAKSMYEYNVTPNKFRIHEGGDFYNDEYLHKWFEICERFPEKTFMAYTQHCNIDPRALPSNLVLKCSIWPDSKPENKNSRLPKVYVFDKTGRYFKNDHVPKEILYKCTFKEDKIQCDECGICYCPDTEVRMPLNVPHKRGL
jgi:hypothetical protein